MVIVKKKRKRIIKKRLHPPTLCKSCVMRIVTGRYQYCWWHKLLTAEVDECVYHMNRNEFKGACKNIRESKIIRRGPKKKVVGEVKDNETSNEEGINDNTNKE